MHGDSSHQLNNRVKYEISLPDLPALNELKAIPQWVAWRYEDRRGPKPTKPPINPHTGEYASASDPSTWGTYEQAVERARKDRLAGVGIMLSEDDNLSAFDFDNVRNPRSGHIKPWLREIIRETYTEISPSDTGLRLFIRGKLPSAIASKAARVEAYSHGRFLTVTGNHMKGTPDTINSAPLTKAACRQRAKLHEETWNALRRAGAKLFKKTVSSNIVELPRKKDGDFWGNVNNAALENLSAWVPSLFPSAEPSNLGYRVASSALGRQLEEDLSITRQGIKDFGVHDMGDPNGGRRSPISLVMEWGSMKTAADAALWLCDCMGADPAALGWRGKREDAKPGVRIETSGEFVAGFVPPDYIVDGLLQEGFLYSLTGATGAGKTAITLRLAASIAMPTEFAGRQTKKRRVLYLAAENPDDIRMRWIALSQHMHFDHDAIEVFFIRSVFKVSQAAARLKEEAEKHGGDFGLVIIDTSPVFYEGDDENNRTQQGRHAEMLRNLIDVIPGRPTIIANCHPVKNAAPDNLRPAGGGNFLNQVDGNLTPARNDSTTEVHWQGKFRGVEFAPMHFLLRTVTHERLLDSRGRLIPTVICEWINEQTKERLTEQRLSDEDTILKLIASDPKASQASLATKLGWKLFNGDPNKMRVSRCIAELTKGKLVKTTRRGNYKLTPEGEAALGGLT